MGVDIDVDWGIEDIYAQGKEDVIDFASKSGIPEFLRRLSGVEEPEDDPTDRPDWWTENRKWAIPAGIGAVALLGMVAFAPRPRRRTVRR